MPSRPRRWRPLLALMLLGALSRPAAASLLVPLDTAQLVARSERIVVGTVLGQQSRWTEDGATIITDVQIRVTGAMLGARDGDVLTVRRLGGTVNDVGMRVFGEASYTDGEEVLVFAERRGDSLFSAGMTQGTLHVTSQGGRKMASTVLSGAELVGRAAAPRPMIRSLDEVVQEVRGAVAARLAAPKTGQKAQPEGKR